MLEILPRDWNLKPIFTQKWASVDMNWGGGSTPSIPTMGLHSRAGPIYSHYSRKIRFLFRYSNCFADSKYAEYVPVFNTYFFHLQCTLHSIVESTSPNRSTGRRWCSDAVRSPARLLDVAHRPAAAACSGWCPALVIISHHSLSPSADTQLPTMHAIIYTIAYWYKHHISHNRVRNQDRVIVKTLTPWGKYPKVNTQGI